MKPFLSSCPSLALDQGARLGQRLWLDYMYVVIPVLYDLVWAANLKM